MKNLVLVRIDERLIHGQVMTQWCRIRHFNTIMIVDDATANDAFLKQVCVMAVPKDFVLLCQTADEAAAYLLGDSDKEEILLLVKNAGYRRASGGEGGGDQGAQRRWYGYAPRPG